MTLLLDLRYHNGGWRLSVAKIIKAPRLGALMRCGSPALGQVVAERGEHHVVVRVGSRPNARPELTIEVGVLDALAQTALRSLVEVIPVAQGAFLNVAGIRGAVGRRAAGDEAVAAGSRNRFRAAARHDVRVNAIAGLLPAPDEDAAHGAVNAVVAVNIEAGGGMDLNRPEAGVAMDQGKLTVRTNGRVRQAGVVVSVSTITPRALHTQIDELVEGRYAQ